MTSYGLQTLANEHWQIASVTDDRAACLDCTATDQDNWILCGVALAGVLAVGAVALGALQWLEAVV